MLSEHQLKFRKNFLSPWKQKLYFLKNLPMALISGIKLIRLDEELSVAVVPFRWCNKNPFRSMYFAVQSMAAELSTAAPVFMALKGIDADVAVIIVDLKAEFVKKAQTKVYFQCLAYEEIKEAVYQLNDAGDGSEGGATNNTATVTIKTVGKDDAGDEVAIFYFTWSFKRRS
jgi:hypothetical protein